MPRMNDQGTPSSSTAGFSAGSTLIPSFRYRDAHAAIAWLERALGFTRHAIYSGDNNTVEHAELRHGTGMIMLGSASNSNPNGRWNTTPGEGDGRVTSSVYLVVPDCVPVWESAQAAGAEVVMELKEMSYGGKAFTVRDPEGYLWALGEYDPWVAHEAGTAAE